MNFQSNRRMIFIIVSAIDAVLGGIVLLIYFGFLPVDLSGLGIPRWIVGGVGAIWFLSAVGLLAYQLTKPDVSE